MRRTLIPALLVVFGTSVLCAGFAFAPQRSARITVITPTFGVPGTTVTIRGAGFSGFDSGTWAKELTSDPPPGAVEFNGVPGDIIFWQDNRSTVKVPIGASSGPVRVINPGANVQVTGASFEVPYSEGSGSRGDSSTGRRSSSASSAGETDPNAEDSVKRGNSY